jgi:hypothetical protein
VGGGVGPFRFRTPMSSESSAARAYRLGVANQVLLLVGPVAATSALGDHNSAVERTDIRSAGAAVSRVALGGFPAFVLAFIAQG